MNLYLLAPLWSISGGSFWVTGSPFPSKINFLKRFKKWKLLRNKPKREVCKFFHCLRSKNVIFGLNLLQPRRKALENQWNSIIVFRKNSQNIFQKLFFFYLKLIIHHLVTNHWNSCVTYIRILFPSPENHQPQSIAVIISGTVGI